MKTTQASDMHIKLRIKAQPDDTTCGPTSLHAVYDYFESHMELDQLISEVNVLRSGGTLAVLLGLDALKRGFKARVYSYNLKVFDPSWQKLPSQDLMQKLEAQLKFKKGKKYKEATRAYISFLEAGGEMRFENLTSAVLRRYLSQGYPILCGLSATYLYQSKREYTNHKNQSVYDDLRGAPMGHFVVLHGLEGQSVKIADPYKENPISGDHYYQVPIKRLINAILLGVITYDANFMVIAPSNHDFI